MALGSKLSLLSPSWNSSLFWGNCILLSSLILYSQYRELECKTCKVAALQAEELECLAASMWLCLPFLRKDLLLCRFQQL